MSFGEFDRHQILDAILRLQAIFFLFTLLLRLLIVVHLIYLFIVRTDTKLILPSSKVLTAYYAIVDVILLVLIHLVVWHLLLRVELVKLVSLPRIHFSLLNHVVLILLWLLSNWSLQEVLWCSGRLCLVMLALYKLFVRKHGGLRKVASSINEGACVHRCVLIILTLVIETRILLIVASVLLCLVEIIWVWVLPFHAIALLHSLILSRFPFPCLRTISLFI